MDDIYKNIEEYNTNKKRKMFIVSDYVIADMLSNINLNPIVTELFIKEKKTFLLVLLRVLFPCTKNLRLNSTHYFIMKILNKRELQQIAFNHSSDIDFLNLYKKCTAKSRYFLVIDTTL